MKLLTSAIQKAAVKQYELGSSFDQMVVAKFFDPCGSWTWYLLNMDPGDLDYCWGIVDGFEIEMGSFSIQELSNVQNKLGIGIERDRYFKPIKAKELWENLSKRKLK
jgi:hypothetical protein